MYRKSLCFPLLFFTWLPLVEAVISLCEICPGHICHRSCCRHPDGRTEGRTRSSGRALVRKNCATLLLGVRCADYTAPQVMRASPKWTGWGWWGSKPDVVVLMRGRYSALRGWRLRSRNCVISRRMREPWEGRLSVQTPQRNDSGWCQLSTSATNVRCAWFNDVNLFKEYFEINGLNSRSPVLKKQRSRQNRCFMKAFRTMCH